MQILSHYHTVLLHSYNVYVKRRKGFGDGYSTELFETISSPKAYAMSEPLPLLSNKCPGSKPLEPEC